MKKLIFLIFLITHINFSQTLEKTVVHDLPPEEEVVYFTEESTNRSVITVTAGTGETLTIEGSDFGEPFEVYFRNANFGGSAFTKAYEIESWTDNEIIVRVPSFAGSGPVRILKADSTSIQTDDIIVPYALINGRHQNVEGRISHVDEYILNINLPEPARTVFEDAVNEVICLTKMNFIIGENTTQTTNALDDVNLVTFSNGLPTFTLAATYNRMIGCIDNGEVDWYVKEIDILINENFNWNYTGNPSSGEFNFFQVMVHELLHAAGMGHVIDENDVMHFATSDASVYPNLNENNLDGRVDQQSYSTTYEVCGQPLFTDGECPTLSIPYIEQNTPNIKSIELSTILGQKINTIYKSLEEIPNGQWFIKITYIDNTTTYKKIIK